MAEAQKTSAAAARLIPRRNVALTECESGSHALPTHPGWVRIKSQCEDAGVAFYFKQWGERGCHWNAYNRMDHVH
jgi:protein gp37